MYLVLVGVGLRMGSSIQVFAITWVHTTGSKMVCVKITNGNQHGVTSIMLALTAGAVQGLKVINNHIYNFGTKGTFYKRAVPSGYVNVSGLGWRWIENEQLFTGFRHYQGSYYWFQNGVRQNNQWETAWGHRYYVGADGRAVQGIVTIDGVKHNFGTNGTFYEREMPKKAAKPYYYSQWDKRWANTWLSGGSFGATGCVPTSAAMVLKRT